MSGVRTFCSCLPDNTVYQVPGNAVYEANVKIIGYLDILTNAKILGYLALCVRIPYVRGGATQTKITKCDWPKKS